MIVFSFRGVHLILLIFINFLNIYFYATMSRMPLSKHQKAIVSLIYFIKLRDVMMEFIISYLMIFLELLKVTRKKMFIPPKEA